MFHVKRNLVKTIINWNGFFILWMAGIVATVLVLPCSLELPFAAVALSSRGITWPRSLATQVVQNAVLAIPIFLGTLLAKHVGLMTPVLEALTRGGPVSNQFRGALSLSILPKRVRSC